ESAAAYEHALPFPQIDFAPADPFQPGLLVPFRKPQKEPLHLDAAALDKQRLEPPRTQVSQSLHQYIGLMECFGSRNLLQDFEDRALRRGKNERPFPMPPGLLDELLGLRIGETVLAGTFGCGANPSIGRSIGVCEQLFSVVKDEARVQMHLRCPTRALLRA